MFLSYKLCLCHCVISFMVCFLQRLECSKVEAWCKRPFFGLTHEQNFWNRNESQIHQTSTHTLYSYLALLGCVLYILWITRTTAFEVLLCIPSCLLNSVLPWAPLSQMQSGIIMDSGSGVLCSLPSDASMASSGGPHPRGLSLHPRLWPPYGAVGRRSGVWAFLCVGFLWGNLLPKQILPRKWLHIFQSKPPPNNVAGAQLMKGPFPVRGVQHY